MIIHGDCLEEMKKMDDNSIDFIVTDPPYGLSFMGKEWDKELPGVYYWKEILRICKPGAMIASFGSSRTHHHLMTSIENAGFEIRDCIMWLYGSGFPKSHNFGKQIGGEWLGYGTALKPAYEPIIIAMKPLDGTFMENARKWGVGGINIDDSRIPNSDKLGRWPANLILDEEVSQQLDEMTGILKSGSGDKHNKTQTGGYNGSFKCLSKVREYKSDYGGASRFFYCAKASIKERNGGLGNLPIKQTMGGGGLNNTEDDVCGKYGSIKAPQRNYHPTVKPISLMKYLLKLLCPPGKPICLDPFAGSGTTLVAAKELGIKCMGIEKEEGYFQIAMKRIEQTSFKDEQKEFVL